MTLLSCLQPFGTVHCRLHVIDKALTTGEAFGGGPGWKVLVK